MNSNLHLDICVALTGQLPLENYNLIALLDGGKLQIFAGAHKVPVSLY